MKLTLISIQRASRALTWFALGGFVASSMNAMNAQTLAPVAPPTDWTGIGIVVLLCLVIAIVVGYIVHIKRTPGLQLGEEQLDALADRIIKRQSTPPVTQVLMVDGITFADQAQYDEYIAAKAVLAKHKGGTP